MGLTDGMMSIPQVVLVLFIEMTHGSTPEVLVFAIAVTSWPAAARIVRSQILLLKQLEYVEAATAMGNSEIMVTIRHILPNMMDTILAVAASQFANSVIVLAITTFVGLGVGSFDWASMMASNFRDISLGQWWLVIPPGVLFSALILSVYWMADSARRALRRGIR
jgi:peptide/nickel transport system permease protein